jgi:hypothetical protein
MTKTTKIILLSTGGLILGVGTFFGIRYIIKRRKEKKQQAQAQLTANMPSPKPLPASFPTITGSINPAPKTGTQPLSTTGNSTTNIITGSGVPVVMASYSTLDPTTPATPTYNPNSVTFKKLDQKLKSLYYILAPLDRKDGKVVYVETEDYKPDSPNSEVRTVMQQTLWREAHNNMFDVLKGFNSEEKDSPTKNYGNLLLEIFKKQRLDYLFPPKTADGKDTMFNSTAEWYKDVEKRAMEKNLKTDFWKIS